MPAVVGAALGGGGLVPAPPPELAGSLMAVPAPAHALAWLPGMAVAGVVAAGAVALWAVLPAASPAVAAFPPADPPAIAPSVPDRPSEDQPGDPGRMVATGIPARLAVVEDPPERWSGSPWDPGLGVRWLGESGPDRPLAVPPGRWWGAMPLTPVRPGALRSLVLNDGVPGLILDHTIPAAALDLSDPAFAGLRALRLVNRRLTREELAAVGRMTGLRDLALVGNTFADDALAAALASHRELEHLDLSGSLITATGARALAPLTGLRSLALDMCRQLDGAALADLGALRGLRSLRWGQLGTAGVRALAAFPELEALRISIDVRDPVQDRDLQVLAGLRGLRALRIGGTGASDPLTAAGLGVLAKLPALEELRIESIPGADDGVLAGLAAAPGLRDLTWGWTGADGSGLRALGGLPIRRLDGAGPSLTAAGVAAIGSLPALESVAFRGLIDPAVLAAAVEALVRARTPVRRINLPGADDRVVALLADLPTVEQLAIYAPTARDLSPLGRLPALRSLALGMGSSQRFDAGTIATLIPGPALTDLALTGGAIDSGAMAAAARIPGIRRLSLDGARIGLRALVPLAAQADSRDRVISHGGTALPLTELAGHPTLRRLSVSGVDGLTPADLIPLRRLLQGVAIEGMDTEACDTCPERAEPVPVPDGFG
jgi:hypothetical protein